MTEAVRGQPGHPVLIDKFLEDASEVDVDAVCRRQRHDRRRGDGAHRGGRHPLRRLRLRHPAVQPRRRRSSSEIREATRLARELKVRGLMNIQFAVKGRPPWSTSWRSTRGRRRTVPFVSKATGMNLAKAAARVMVGVSLDEQGLVEEPIPSAMSRSRRRCSRSRSSRAWTSCSGPRCNRPAR